MKIAKQDIWMLETKLEYPEGFLTQLYIAVVSKEKHLYYLPSTNNTYIEAGQASMSAQEKGRTASESLFAEFPEDTIANSNYTGKDAKLYSSLLKNKIKVADDRIIELFDQLVGNRFGVVDFEELIEVQKALNNFHNKPARVTFDKFNNMRNEALMQEENARKNYSFFDPSFKKTSEKSAQFEK